MIPFEGTTDITALFPLHIALIYEIHNPSHHNTIFPLPYTCTMHVFYGNIIFTQGQTRTSLCHHQLYSVLCTEHGHSKHSKKEIRLAENIVLNSFLFDCAVVWLYLWVIKKSKNAKWQSRI